MATNLDKSAITTQIDTIRTNLTTIEAAANSYSGNAASSKMLTVHTEVWRAREVMDRLWEFVVHQTATDLTS